MRSQQKSTLYVKVLSILHCSQLLSSFTPRIRKTVALPLEHRHLRGAEYLCIVLDTTFIAVFSCTCRDGMRSADHLML